MSAPDISEAAASERIPEDLVEAGVYPTFAAAFEHSVVVLAMGQACWLFRSENGHRLLVEPQALDAARKQLACFDRESIGWPPQPVGGNVARRETEIITPLLWSLVVLAVFRGQGERPGWTLSGVLDTQAVFDRGEWWRLGTALFLHADPGHVISNALNGILAFSAVLTTIGRRRGWLLLALAALTGNLAVAAMNYPGPYRSLGASTAIFGGIGLLTGRAIRLVARADHPHRWRAMFVPLAAGLTVLGLYGAGGMQIDVGAHLTGFIAGLVLGFAAATRGAGG
ncbi:MAG: rhomboid family intramembrane serine protease [Verrucomicrobia bacterium]|nr:rhomboid family intramembrane serine protease [Verrucomicrobiota bacterium]